jgi:hypothetical protein
MPTKSETNLEGAEEGEEPNRIERPQKMDA